MPYDLNGREYVEPPIKINISRIDSLSYLQEINTAIADNLFPERDPRSMFIKLFEEIGEMVRNPGSAEEMADVMIMIMDHATMNGVNLSEAIRSKLEKNMSRVWVVNGMGVMKHV